MDMNPTIETVVRMVYDKSNRQLGGAELLAGNVLPGFTLM